MLIERQRMIQPRPQHRRRPACVLRRAKNTDHIRRRSLIFIGIVLDLHVDPDAPSQRAKSPPADRYSKKRSAEAAQFGAAARASNDRSGALIYLCSARAISCVEMAPSRRSAMARYFRRDRQSLSAPHAPKARRPRSAECGRQSGRAHKPHGTLARTRQIRRSRRNRQPKALDHRARNRRIGNAQRHVARIRRRAQRQLASGRTMIVSGPGQNAPPAGRSGRRYPAPAHTPAPPKQSAATAAYASAAT
jgi:hypothetical protein